jgi:transforming growth factor-beta-induced protein
MYKASTIKKSLLAVTALSVSLMSASVFAAPGKPGKPGKPGDNAVAPGGNIVEVALAANSLLGEFDYLLGAVGCLTDAEGNNPVVNLLTGSDKYTLFAPTDAAFEALQGALGIAEPNPSATCDVDSIFGKGTLLTILAYHVTDGRRFSHSVFNSNNSKEIEMLAGGYITSTPSLSIIDGVPQVVSPVAPLIDINASNGVVHVIDTVMLPFNPFAGD